MKKYNIVNNVVGWVVFAIAAFTYCSTIEPTASFWDCPEFITTAAKLEVGHPPGAPFFMLFGNLFSLFASDATQIAKMINTMNALLSAGCILFLFWSVTHLAKKLLVKDGAEPSVGQLLAVMGSGIAGALIYTWSDTFWFSAVEGEVYAFSSFFTALVFWLILKWEDNADQPHSDRWLVFIAYLVGLSIGVHLLNLLCIPAIVLVYYYKMSKNPTGKGSLLVLGVSVIIVAAVLYGIVPGIVKIGGWFELLFVNELGMPYNIGLYIYLTLLTIALVWALWETTKAVSEKRMYISFIVCTGLLGIPFYGHGVASVVIGIIVLGIIAGVLFFTKKATPRILNTAILCMTLMTVGYSSYAVIVIRSTANPPMDQNSPEDVFTLGEYLGREQYGDRPLFFGQTYKSQPEIKDNGDGTLSYATEKGAPVYQRKDKENESEKDEYVKIRDKFTLKYPSNQSMLFPRIYSDDPNHVQAYESWLGTVSYHSVEYRIPGRETQTIEIPGQVDNIRFFLSYQMNWMYWRYFMWNFAGRQNDIQGNGELEHGNWLSGFSFLDNARLGDQDLLPSDLKNNKGHNVFFCLPLILGLIGFFWQAFRDRKGIQQFWVVFFLFFMTGIAIVLYLNQTPLQPRERDYAYAGSFYAFSIWCGLGIAGIYELLGKWLSKKMEKRMAGIIAGAVGLVPAVAVPAQMVSQTWDDHDRSDRYMCRDFGLNYLETIPHDGVIYTNGDNDTFPLWYNEDTEGNRTDVRVCNLSYLQTDWYIDQMKRPAYSGENQSSPLPILWKRYQYTAGKHEMIDVNPEVGGGMTVKDIVQQLTEQDSALAKRLWGENPFELKDAIQHFVLHEYDSEGLPEGVLQQVKAIPACLPSDTLFVTVDKEAVRRSGMMLMGDSIPDQMVISLKGQGRVQKNFMMMLEMIAQTNFSRPLYMSTTVGASNFGNLWRHFIQEGMAWRISPYTFEENTQNYGIVHSVIDTEKAYDNMMNKYHYGNLKQRDLYIDETTMRMCYTHRRWFANLITNLVKEGDYDKALKALEKCETEIPSYNVPHSVDGSSLDLADAYIACNQPEKAVVILEQVEKRLREYVNWYLALSNTYFANSTRDCHRFIYILASIQETYNKLSTSKAKKASEYGKKAQQMDGELQKLYSAFITRCDNLGIQVQ
ncbi:MAG: DUF2723 domain-containing protein [Bacteroidaceae bacterium]|jgi:hypothetical protein|nr:DUF2723 domain-containing protein [Bacteroidaceae bacterium]MBR3618561.1 DUF2723 domain-containing protein [Bacteroidaceae bacterium]